MRSYLLPSEDDQGKVRCDAMDHSWVKLCGWLWKHWIKTTKRARPRPKSAASVLGSCHSTVNKHSHVFFNDRARSWELYLLGISPLCEDHRATGTKSLIASLGTVIVDASLTCVAPHDPKCHAAHGCSYKVKLAVTGDIVDRRQGGILETQRQDIGLSKVPGKDTKYTQSTSPDITWWCSWHNGAVKLAQWKVINTSSKNNVWICLK